MRRRKWKLLAAMAVALALLVGLAFALRAPPNPAAGVTQENIERVVDGLPITLAEAEAILGCPPGDYRTKQAERRQGITAAGPVWSVAKWYTDAWEVTLHVDDAGRVHGCGARRVEPPGRIEQFIGRAKRQWRAWFPEPPVIDPPRFVPDWSPAANID